MGEHKKLRGGSLSLKFILELYFGIILPRKMMTNKNTLAYNERYIRDTFRWLENKGYIEYFKLAGKRYCYLTEKGFAVLEHTDSRYEINPVNRRRHQFYEREAREQARSGEVYLAMERCDILASPNLRSTLEDLLNEKKILKKLYSRYEGWHYAPNGKKKEYSSQELFQEGIYFTSQEIRYAAMQMNLGDMFKMSRMEGVLIYRDRIFICYNTMERMLRWNNSCEDTAVLGLSRLFYGFGMEEGGLKVQEKEIIGIVFGHRYGTNLKKLVWGNTKEMPTEATEDKIHYLSSKLLYSGNIRNFSKMYYLTLENDQMIPQMKRLLSHVFAEDLIAQREEKVFNKIAAETGENWIWMNEWDRGGVSWGQAGKKHNVYRLTDLELNQLRELLEKEEEYYLITFEEYGPYLQEILGGKLKRLYYYESTRMDSIKLRWQKENV